MTTKTNSIDVIIPTYNCEQYILQACKSAANQIYKPQSIIVVDDGSTDQTETIIKNYSKYSKIAIKYYHKNNGGPNSARNLGIAKSNAEYLAFLDADDIWHH
ncbi:MAG TPA: beta-1,3-N-acetylglucosaminyltransferase, partial [Spirochaetia bacterium]|nr:beta-1,3-N-acetylglucosaminyltransferase [Spirochaetia bacterium]